MHKEAELFFDEVYVFGEEGNGLNNIEIRRPRIEDIDELNEFFRIVVTDTFAREGLAWMIDDIEDEIKDKKKYLKSDFGGVGNTLLNAIYVALQNKGVQEFCLDSGYTNAQKIWEKKFGGPDYLIKDYWGEGYHHMIWRVKIKDISV